MPTILSIKTLHTGFCTHPGCMALKGAGLTSQCFPSQIFLIETKEGFLLFDTGYASHFHDATTGIYSIYKKVTPVYHQEAESAIHQIKSQGLQPSDIKAIVVSHYHGDHIAGLRDFPNTPLITCKDTFNFHSKLKGLNALQHGFLPHLVPEQYTLMPIQNMAHTSMQIDEYTSLPVYITPFSGVYIIPLPGHAKGHIGAILKTTQGYMLLAGDAAWRHENYTTLTGPNPFTFIIQDNKKQYYNSLRLLHTLHQKGMQIVLTHDSSKSPCTTGF